MARKTDGRAANGGVRPGAGRLPTTFTLSRPGVIYLRELTRARLGRRDVTRDEMSATLERAFMDYARQQDHEAPPDAE